MRNTMYFLGNVLQTLLGFHAAATSKQGIVDAPSDGIQDEATCPPQKETRLTHISDDGIWSAEVYDEHGELHGYQLGFVKDYKRN